MLGSYMDDIGITAEQFEEACGRGKGKIRSQFQHGLFEQVYIYSSEAGFKSWSLLGSADDYQISKKKMMMMMIVLSDYEIFNRKMIKMMKMIMMMFESGRWGSG